jgi:hypothetical protein
VRIGERVRAAHLSQTCPGGLGFPVSSPGPAGSGAERAAGISRSRLTGDDHAAHAAGQTCVRCCQPIEADHDVRRRRCGDWVHESCPLRHC